MGTIVVRRELEWQGTRLFAWGLGFKSLVAHQRELMFRSA
jgi:hypothetical protein